VEEGSPVAEAGHRLALRPQYPPLAHPSRAPVRRLGDELFLPLLHCHSRWATGNRKGNICKESGSVKGLRCGGYSRRCHSVPRRIANGDGILVVVTNARVSLGESREVTRCLAGDGEGRPAGRVFRGGQRRDAR
jgi:hypothetical protein